MTELIVSVGILALLVAMYFIFNRKKDLDKLPPSDNPTEPIKDPYCCKNESIREDGVDCSALDTKFKCEKTGQSCCTWDGVRCVCNCNLC